MRIESKWEIDCQLKCHISRSHVGKINRGGYNRIVESLGSDWRAKPESYRCIRQFRGGMNII